MSSATHTRHLRQTGGVGGDERSQAERVGAWAKPQGRQHLRGGHQPWGDHHRAAGDDPAVGKAHPGEAVVDHLKGVHRAGEDPNAPGGQLLGLLVGQGRCGVGEQHEVGGPLPEQQRLVDRPRPGAKHADGLVADLPPRVD